MNNTKKIKRPKMSEVMKGKQNRLGKKMSEEAKRERKRRMGERSDSPRRIPIIDIASNTVYSSITHAAVALGISANTVSRSIKYKYTTLAGQKFMRVHERYPVGF